MNTMLRRSWLGRFQHPSEETLLAYLDGEVAARRQRQIASHLKTCWSCRNRRDKIERAIGAVMDCIGAEESADLPDPRTRHVFETRLHAMAAQTPGIGFWRSVAMHTGPLAYACASAVLAVLILWSWLSSTPAVSAMELLSRAQAVQSRRVQDVGLGVGYQTLRVRRTSTRAHVQQVATVELRDSGRTAELASTSGDPVWSDIERILRINGIERPLSAAAFDEWRSSIPRARESVSRSRLEDGSEAFQLETASALPHRPDTILESTLVVRAGDWRPVAQNLTVQAVEDVVEYEFTELAFNVRPAALAAVPRFSGRKDPHALPAPPALEPPAVVVPPLPVFMADLEAVEMQARYTLHHLGACRGEPIEIVRDPSGSVLVRGLAETPERKEELLEALGQLPWTKVEIRTVEEATEGQPERAAAEQAERAAPAAAAIPIQSQLEAYFKKRVDPALVSDEIASLANQASTLAQSLLADAGALRALAEAYPPRRAAALNPAFQRLLEEMFADHAAALRSQAAECRMAVEPVLATLAPQPAASTALSSSRDGLSALFDAARDAERLTILLFTGSTEPCAKPEQEAARLLAALREVEMHSTVAAQEFNRGFFASANPKDSRGR